MITEFQMILIIISWFVVGLASAYAYARFLLKEIKKSDIGFLIFLVAGGFSAAFTISVYILSEWFLTEKKEDKKEKALISWK